MDNRVTQCPRCSTSFRVSAAHLAVAAGAVRCGSCLHIFNALENWVDADPVIDPAETDSDHLEFTLLDDTVDEPAEPAALIATAEQPPAAPESDSASVTPDEVTPERLEPELGDLAWESPWTDDATAEPDHVAAYAEFSDSAPPAYDTEAAHLSLDVEPAEAAPLHYETPATDDPATHNWLRPQALIAPGFADARIAAPTWAEAENDDELAPALSADVSDEAIADNAGTSSTLADRGLIGTPAPAGPDEDDGTGSGHPDAGFVLNHALTARRDDDESFDFDDELLIDDDTPLNEDGIPLRSAPATTAEQDDSPAVPEPLMSSDPCAPWEEEPSRRFDDALLADDAGDGSEHPDEEWAEQLLAEETAQEQQKPEPDVEPEHNSTDDAEVPAPAALLGNFEPEPLQIEQFRGRRRWPGLLWSSILLLALLGLGAQYVYFHFEQLAQGPWRPWLAQGCELAGCRLPPQLDASRIATDRLVVRTHPGRDSALAVDALLINNAPFRQPYPDLQLQFSDLHGEPVAGRRFAPDEYLAGEIRPDALMPVRQQIRIALEIADPGPAAVNYSLTVVPFEQSR
ncbi:MAG: DUF3426 domain-containing protein [Spongiibacteraceae bacterium]|jgi:predicted Zn finger-like uncharacterized protein|nr:DUF3426 domain-containing protein [Spongiibacteraceae bacterium]